MRYLKGFISILFILIFSVTLSAKSAPVIKVETDKQEVNLGEILIYKVEVTLAGEQQSSPEIIFPELSKFFQVQDIFTRSSVNILNGKTYVSNVKEAHLIANRIGEMVLPASQIEVREAKTGRLIKKKTKTVKVLVRESSGDKVKTKPTVEIDVLKPIKASAKISIYQWLPWAIAGVLVILVMGISYYLKNKPKAKPVKPAKPLDTRTPLQRAVDNWKKAEKLLQTKKFNQLYTELSAILRRYLGEEFNFKAEEATSREFLNRAKKLNFKAEYLIELTKYCSLGDRVKFANLEPTLKEAEQTYQHTKQLIEVTDKLNISEVSANLPDKPIENKPKPAKQAKPEKQEKKV